MPSVVQRRITSPVVAVKPHGFETIPVGSIVETPNDLHEPGLHAIRFGDEELFAFRRDIDERSEAVDAPPESRESLPNILSLHEKKRERERTP